MEQYTLHPLSPRDVSTIMQLCTLYCTVTGWLEALAQSTFYNTTSSQADNTLFLSGGVCSKYTLPIQTEDVLFLSGGACSKYTTISSQANNTLFLYGLAQSTSYHTNTGQTYSFYLEGLAQSTSYQIITGRRCSVFIWRGLPKVHLTIPTQDKNTQFPSGGACSKYILPLPTLAKNTQFSSGGACSKYILPYQHWLKIQF